ncbi:g2917 [Coccomyxa viridis]|uniref:G2917 protein n=1 Tax=Coccomyxa viridis TaxID=1274662 RepID=A0ABP1FLJ3_9CHLO
MEVCSGAFVEPVLRVNKFFAAGTSPRTKRRVLEERVVENGEEKGLEMKRIKLQEVDYSNTTTFAPVPGSPTPFALLLESHAQLSARFSSVEGAFSQVNALQSEVSGLHSKVSGLQSEVSGLQSEVSGLQSENNGLHSKVSGLQSEVSGFQSENNGLHSKVSGLQTEVGTLKSEVSALKTKCEGNATTIKSLRTERRDLLTENSSYAQQNSGYVEQIGVLGKTIAELSKNLADTTSLAKQNQSLLRAYSTVLMEAFGAAVLVEFRDHIRNEAADILGLKDKEKIHALLHWDRYFPNVPFSQQKMVKHELGADRYCFMLTETSGNKDLAPRNDQVHRVNRDASVGLRSLYLDVLSSARTAEVRPGAEEEFCKLIGKDSIKQARADIIAELASQASGVPMA